MKAGRVTAPRKIEKSVDGPVVGIDEVGRAPFAGPVMAAAVLLPRGRLPKKLKGLTDSKKLSRGQREAYAEAIEGVGRCGLGAASVTEIDRLNIHHATLLAMARAYRNLGVPAELALIDGKFAPGLPCATRTVVGGDSKSASIAAASVVAKVARDRMMARLAERHPGYGWESNAGYGSEAHYAGLMRLGPSVHHRRSFDVVRRFCEDLFLRGLKFRPVGDIPSEMTQFPLRQDFVAVIDGGGHHLGFFKSGRKDWAFSAMGYDADGTPLPGGGPLAALHGQSFAAADARLLRSAVVGSHLAKAAGTG